MAEEERNMGNQTINAYQAQRMWKARFPNIQGE